MTSVKVGVNGYSNRKFLSATPRSVLTIDPQSVDGNMLTHYARFILPDPGTLTNLIHQQQEPDRFIRKTR